MKQLVIFRPMVFVLRAYFLIALLSTIVIQSIAQTPKPNYREITGVVTNAKGEPLEGVTVRVAGTEVVTLTLKDGSYSIKIQNNVKNPSLQFSILSYVNKQVVVGKATVLNITLESSAEVLDDVVVIGYGTVRKKDLTGAVAKINVADLQKAPVKSIDEALAGRVAGVQVISADGQPDGTSEIIIRGVGSITQSSAPLYVIDGFPQETANFNTLNPADIESIEVLKDASATAIYGARGSNGVIMITTKKGKSPKPQLSYTGSYGFQNPIKFMKLMGPYEFVRLQNDMNPVFANAVYFTNGKTLEDYKNAQGIDWQDLLFNDYAGFQMHNLSLSAKVNKTSYAISGSYGEQEGLIVKSGFKRYQARIVLDQDVTDKLKIGVNTNFAKFKGYGQIPANQTTPPGQVVNNANWNFMTNLWSYRPVLGAKATDLSFVYEELLDNNVDEGGVPNSGRVNPYIQALNEVNDRFTTNINANAYLQYKLNKYFTWKSTVGINLLIEESFKFNNSMTNSGSPLTSYGQTYGINGSTSRGTNQSVLNENTLSYVREFSKKHSVNAVVGATFQKYNYETYGFSASNLPNESLGYKGLGQGTPFQVSSGSSLSRMESFLGRVNYTYNRNYLFTVSMRADGSSKFAPENRWGYFPSGAFAWKISNEPFMKKLRSFVDESKLRLSYGATGNNRVSDFAYLSLLTANTSNFSGSYYSYNNQTIYNIVVNTMGNRNLKWETGLQTDIGLDLSMFNRKVNVEIDYYNRVTKDLLLNASMPYATGFTSAFTNVGKVSNSGLEFTLNTTNIKKKDFTWTSSFNISFNKNKLLSLNSGEDALLTAKAFDASVGSNANYIAKVGQPVAQFYGLISAGMYQLSDFYQVPNGSGFVYILKENIPYYSTRSSLSSVQTDTRIPVQPGDPKFVDLNGDGVIDANDYTTIGNPYPKHFGGLTNNFSYKNFELNVFLQWSYGNEIMNANRIKFEGGTNASVTLTSLGTTGGGVNFNMFDTYKNRWTPENPSNIYPRANANAGGTRQYSTRVVEDGSYLRVKTVQLSYNIPVKVIKRLKLNSARIYISGQNLLTLTKYTGPDPEVSTYAGSALTPGFDYSPYPRTRVLTFGTNITL